MRYHFFLHYGWFLQNFEKDFIPTLLHTTVCSLRFFSHWISCHWILFAIETFIAIGTYFPLELQLSLKLSYHWTCCCKQQKRGHGNKLLEPQEQVSRLKSLVEKNMQQSIYVSKEVGGQFFLCPRGQRVGSAPNVHESPRQVGRWSKQDKNRSKQFLNDP